jgi:hypothetical protein
LSEFSDLKKLREVLDSLTPPMVMVGRCRDCRHWARLDKPSSDKHDCNHDEWEFLDYPPYTHGDFGCTLWERKP